MEWSGIWDEFLNLVEFAYDNSWQSSIRMAPFEDLYGRHCRTPICWDEIGEKRIEGPKLVQIVNEKIEVAKRNMRDIAIFIHTFTCRYLCFLP